MDFTLLGRRISLLDTERLTCNSVTRLVSANFHLLVPLASAACLLTTANLALTRQSAAAELEYIITNPEQSKNASNPSVCSLAARIANPLNLVISKCSKCSNKKMIIDLKKNGHHPSFGFKDNVSLTSGLS